MKLKVFRKIFEEEGSIDNKTIMPKGKIQTYFYMFTYDSTRGMKWKEIHLLECQM